MAEAARTRNPHAPRAPDPRKTPPMISRTLRCAATSAVAVGGRGVLLLLLLLAAGAGVPTSAAHAATTLGCDQATSPILIASSGAYQLDRSCVYTRRIEIAASDVTLDCRRAVISDVDDVNGPGILIAVPTDVALANVLVKNCEVRGFLNNVRVNREGFKQLAEGHEYDVQFSNVRIENSKLYESRGSGIFVNGYVTGVTLRNLEIAYSGGVGIYLEAGSKGTVVERNHVHDNGYGDVTPEGIPVVVGGIEFRYLSTGREGIAVDGARDSRIVRNRIENNSAGGIFLYKNCGEDFTQQPNQWWTRRYGADSNVIENNKISGAYTGVWIGSRMAENTLFMDCSDPSYISNAVQRVHLDYARDNVVRRNTFANVEYGIRVEDDGNRIESNRFRSTNAAHQAVLVGTAHRTNALGLPVTDTVMTGNSAQIRGNASPYGWIHGHVGTVFDRNRASGRLATLAPGVQPAINFHLFVKELWVAP